MQHAITIIAHCNNIDIIRKELIKIIEAYIAQKGLKKPKFSPQSNNIITNYFVSKKSILEISKLNEQEINQLNQIENDIIKEIEKIFK